MRAAKAQPDDLRHQTAAAVARMAGGGAFEGMADLQAISNKSTETFADEAMFVSRLRRAEFAEALAVVDTMAKKQPARAQRWDELRGTVELQRRDLVRARAAFERAYKSDPSAYSALGPLVDIEVLEGRPAEALERLRAFLVRQPQNPSALLTFALLTSRQPDASPQQVRPLFEAAVNAAPAEPAPRLRQIEYLMRRSLFKDALAAGQNALAAIPDNARLLDAVGQAQAKAGDVEQAAKTFRRLAGLVQNSPTPHLRLAELYASSGRFDAAESAYRSALDADPLNMTAQQGLVDVLTRTKKSGEALAFVRRARSTRPNLPSGYALEALVLGRQGDMVGALRTLQTGIQRTGSGELAARLVGHLLRSGQTALAESEVQNWLKRSPGDPEARYLNASVALIKGDNAKAESELRLAIERAPRHAAALNNLAWLLSEKADPAGVSFARRAVEQQPDSPAFLDTLALTLAATGQLAQAQAVHKRAIELAPDDANLRFTAAKLAILAGDKASARAEIERLEKLGPDYPRKAEVAKLRERL